ncbi:MAG: dihydrolipoyl dehydrogenase [bacterium]
MKIANYNIVIIGGGPGGYTAAIKAAIKGAKVAVVEVDKLGGVCLNRGCIPSKALIASAEQYQKMKSADSFGIDLATPPVYNWPNMLTRKNKIVDMLVGGISQLFKSHGVEHINGFGRITGKNEVTVTQEDGTEIKLKTDNIIIATGSRSRNLPIFPIDGKRIINTDHLLEAENLPESMLIIGAGVIGCEWACMLALLEVKVTVVEILDQALPLEDSGVGKQFERELKKLKVNILTKTSVDKVEPGTDGIKATLSNGKEINANQVLVAVGRAFNTEDLGLEEVGVKLNKNGSIITDDSMRTNIKNIFAIGDVRGEILLAYTAVHDGDVAVDNALGGKMKKDYTGVPSVIFTHPEVATVGLTEENASKNHEISIGKFPMRVLGKAHAENEIAGEVKVIADSKTDKLLGVHIVGNHATEIIHTAALAINRGLTANQLGSLIFGHPVLSEAIMEAAHDVHGMSVHLAKKKK